MVNEEYWQNPFEKSLVEDWMVENFPQNYGDMVACFFAPDFMNLLESIEVKPKILMGGRGTGKSHILRMLAVQSVINRIVIEKANKKGTERDKVKPSLFDYKEAYFGIYIKATIFSPLSTANVTYLSEDQLNSLFEHLFNMQIAISIVNGLRFLIENCDDIPTGTEEAICEKLSNRFGDIISGKTSEDILVSLNNQIETIQQVVKNLPWYKDFTRFEGKISFTTAPDFLVVFFNIIREVILERKVLFILLDEYDELDEYQQIFINRLIRSRTLTFRIASAIGGIKTLEYAKGKELSEIHDYDPFIPLHFEALGGKRNRYRRLLRNIFINRLTVYGDYKIKNPDKLLPKASLQEEGLSAAEVEKELEKIKKKLTKNRTIKNPKKYWSNLVGHYREAVIYSLLRSKGRDKLYAGFDEYASISSGIVRQFILLCRGAFSAARVRGIAIEEGNAIPIKLQSEAAESVSANQLYLELSRSIPSGHGPKLVQFTQDLGRILQAKLYYSTEPQANRFEVTDSQSFARNENKIPREIFENGLIMPHFLSEIAFKPKQPQYSLSLTFSLNGIFAPTLKVPPEKRWRTPLTVSEIRGLCSDENREETIAKIIHEIRGKRRKQRETTKIREKENISEEKSLFERPISLSNCPITGYGCDQNLIEHTIQERSLKAFLAVPFDEYSWVIDPRRWIKTAMSDHLGIRCVDADDFPGSVSILCKICSSVRQMPIGLFEITELNSNVIFELGMATPLGKLNFMLVHKKYIPAKYKDNYPPKPLTGMRYVTYPLSQNGITQKMEREVRPLIENETRRGFKHWCWVLNGECPHTQTEPQHNIVLLGLPYDQDKEFFNEVEQFLRKMLSKHYTVELLEPAQSINEQCQVCVEIRKSSFCIIDTTSNDTMMLLALGIAFGTDREFIQLHNVSLSPQRPISDLRSWAMEYHSLTELSTVLKEELPKRLELLPC